MRILIPALFLSLILALLFPAVQSRLRKALAARPALLFLVPAILSGVFCVIAVALGALKAPLAAVILAATALPEEILFRALIQNWLMQKLGAKISTMLLAALIFGCAHLNNGPQPLPNWRYMIMATIAGFAYGKVFEKSSSIFASAMLHALVNTIN